MIEGNSGLATASQRSERPFVRANYSNPKNVKLCKRLRFAGAIFILKSFPTERHDELFRNESLETIEISLGLSLIKYLKRNSISNKYFPTIFLNSISALVNPLRSSFIPVSCFYQW